jgi:hypothetical protein
MSVPKKYDYPEADASPRACIECGEVKAYTLFKGRLDHKHRKYYRSKMCRACINKRDLANGKQWAQDSPEKRMISLERRAELFAEQEGLCGICKKTLDTAGSRTIAVDHDHDTGKVRGLLCSRCNVGLGCFDDDPDTLRLARAYVLTHL